ncbi:unnamed protein product [Brassica napus]|uniref:(rape) hypothetical protein n=1 Tax=Brassica napus TaxID=3708 RepID=A0A816KZ84_BRANA|nr:unnamed protein product [Brassica napus]
MATQKQIQTSSVSNEKVTIQDLRPWHTTKLRLEQLVQILRRSLCLVVALNLLLKLTEIIQHK